METKNTIFLIIVASIFGAICSAAAVSYLAPNASSSAKADSTILVRLTALEQKFDEERAARIMLQELLSAQVEQSASGSLQVDVVATESLSDVSENESDEDETVVELNDSLQSRQAARFARSQIDFKKQVLVDAGLNEDEAGWIVQNESEAVLQQLYDQYESQRKAFEELAENNDRPSSQQDLLRAKIGDDYYERYLAANGWPTTVGISSVIPGSPGHNAGLQAGDNIVSYNGQRVFRLRDVNNLTIEGRPGESVLIEVERDGDPVQLTIPRGPIGIQGAGRFRR